MSKTRAVYFLKRNFEVEVELNEFEAPLWKELEAAILAARPSRLDNVLEIEVLHRVDLHVPMLIQSMCERGIKRITLRTKYPVASKIATDPRPYMLWVYLDGSVDDQWTEMSKRPETGDEFMVDVMEITFDDKTVTDCVWSDDSPFAVVAGTEHQPSA